MTSIQQVKDELAARAKLISGLRCYAEMPALPTPPAFCIEGPTSWQYDTTFDESWQLRLRLWIYVPATDPTRAQQALDAYIAPSGTKSLRQTLYDNEITPEVIQTLRVIGGTRPYGLVTFEGGATLFAAALEAEVIPV